jgi:predicted RNase H-like HicB family nuclease
MITEYVRAAMRRATYELMEDDEGFFGHIPGCQGAWGSAPTLEACRDELQEALADWILIKLRQNDADFTAYDGLELNPRPAAADVA